jgi:transposase InsO family protein
MADGRHHFTNHLRGLGLVPSYGSTGDCYDNAATETFWATLKRELSWIHVPLIYMSRSRLRNALLDYIEIFYNRERVGYRPWLTGTSRMVMSASSADG